MKGADSQTIKENEIWLSAEDKNNYYVGEEIVKEKIPELTYLIKKSSD